MLSAMDAVKRKEQEAARATRRAYSYPIRKPKRGTDKFETVSIGQKLATETPFYLRND